MSVFQVFGSEIPKSLEMGEERTNRSAKDKLAAKLRSAHSSDRLAGILALRAAVEAGEPVAWARGALEEMLGDSDGDCKWQSLLALVQILENDRDGLWELVVRHGNSIDADTRGAIACVVLEHLLEEDFDSYFARLLHLMQFNQLYAETASICYQNSISSENWSRFQSTISQFLEDGKGGRNR